MTEKELEVLKKNSERYLLLRSMRWWDGPLCVIMNPKPLLTSPQGLGTHCPSGDWLDNLLDHIKEERENG